MKEETTRSEPSFGIVGFNRQTHGGGGTELFGSDIPHGNIISLAIYHATEYRDPYNTRYTTNNLKPIVEVHLSPLQFSELLTTMNIGFGVPCTVRSTETSGNITHTPAEHNERELVSNDLRRQSAKIGKYLDAVIAALGDKTLTQAKRQAILDDVKQAKMAIESNMPYMIERYEGRIDKVTNDCKAEVEAYVVSHVIEAGLTALSLPTAKPMLGLEVREGLKNE